MNKESLVSHAIQTNGKLRKLPLVDRRPYPVPDLFEAIADENRRDGGSGDGCECSPTRCVQPGQ
jgi:hypothetical protein